MAELPPTVYENIPAFPGYRVGSDGTVWSCWQRSYRKGQQGPSWVQSTLWRRLATSQHSSGHLRVSLTKDSKKSYRQVHRLVLEVFVGPCPEGMEACHFPDRDPTNNHLANLRWDTQEANHTDRKFHGTILRGTQVKSAKLTPLLVRQLRAEYAEGRTTVSALASKFGLARYAISQCVEGKTWAHVDSVVL